MICATKKKRGNMSQLIYGISVTLIPNQIRTGWKKNFQINLILEKKHKNPKGKSANNREHYEEFEVNPEFQGWFNTKSLLM